MEKLPRSTKSERNGHCKLVHRPISQGMKEEDQSEPGKSSHRICVNEERSTTELSKNPKKRLPTDTPGCVKRRVRCQQESLISPKVIQADHIESKGHYNFTPKVKWDYSDADEDDKHIKRTSKCKPIMEFASEFLYGLTDVDKGQFKDSKPEEQTDELFQDDGTFTFLHCLEPLKKPITSPKSRVAANRASTISSPAVSNQCGTAHVSSSSEEKRGSGARIDYKATEGYIPASFIDDFETKYIDLVVSCGQIIP